MKKLFSFCAAVAVALSAHCAAPDVPEGTIDVVAGGKAPPMLSSEADAAAVMRAVRGMIPLGDVRLGGSLVMRNRRGIVSKEFGYAMSMHREAGRSAMEISLSPRGGTNVLAVASVSRSGASRPKFGLVEGGKASAAAPSMLDRVMETDVTWLDLTFDFLWWPQAKFEADREGETVHGQNCLVVFATPPAPIDGLSGVRLWVDRKTGCMLQAEQVDEKGKPVRRMWGARIKKFGERWMASVIEVETLGSRHRTKIVVDSLEVAGDD